MEKRKQVIKILQHVVKLLKDDDIFVNDDFSPIYTDDGEIIDISRFEEYFNKQVVKIKKILV